MKFKITSEKELEKAVARALQKNGLSVKEHSKKTISSNKVVIPYTVAGVRRIKEPSLQQRGVIPIVAHKSNRKMSRFSRVRKGKNGQSK